MDKKCDKCNTPLQYTEGNALYCALCNIEYVSLKRRIPSEDEIQRALAHRICKNCKFYEEYEALGRLIGNACSHPDARENAGHYLYPKEDFGCNQWEDTE